MVQMRLARFFPLLILFYRRGKKRSTLIWLYIYIYIPKSKMSVKHIYLIRIALFEISMCRCKRFFGGSASGVGQLTEHLPLLGDGSRCCQAGWSSKSGHRMKSLKIILRCSQDETVLVMDAKLI